jgi:hypothetical protein
MFKALLETWRFEKCRRKVADANKMLFQLQTSGYLTKEAFSNIVEIQILMSDLQHQMRERKTC